MNAPVDLSMYQSYRGLPTLAGLATLAEAARPCLVVEECVARLKRFHHAFGAGTGPKNIRSIFSFPMTRANSCIVQ